MLEYEAGECDRCGHDRSKTRVVADRDERVCILCEGGISGGFNDE